jgi:hypothetical protein
MIKTLAILLLSATAAIAEAPLAIVTGPSGGVPGDLIVLDAGESVADHLAWAMIPEPADGRQSMLIVDEGRKAIIASIPGQYTIILAVSNADGVAIRQHKIAISGGTVAPVRRIEPDQTFGLLSDVRSWLSGVSVKTNQQALADAFERAAQQATSIADLKKTSRDSGQNLSSRLVATAIGGVQNASNWAPVFKPMGERIAELEKAGDLKTLDDWKNAWREIAAGLR